MDQREREVQATLHATGVGADAAVGRITQPHPLQERVAALGDLPRGEAMQAALELHMLAPGEKLVEGGVLKGDADHVAHCGTLAEDVVTADSCRAGGGR